MPLPPDGTILLLGYSRPGETSQSRPKQAMIVRMSEKTLDLLESFPQLQFEFSENPGLMIGDTFFSVTSVPETSPHDLYLRTSLANKKNAPLKLYANITGKFTVERQLDDRITDKVRASTVDAQKERAGRAAIFLDTAADLLPNNGKKRNQGNTSSMFRKPVRPTDHPRRPTPSIPAPSPPDRASSTPIQPQRSKEALQSLRKRTICCVATSERTSDQVVKLVGGSTCSEATKRDILELLEEIAEPIPLPNGSKAPKTYRLKTKSWLEVRPYEMAVLTESERTNLARAAKRALRDLKIPESDPAWNHVQYRNQNGTQASDHPKRGITSTTAKEKKVTKPKDTGEVMMKNESIKASKSRPSTSNPIRDDDAARTLPPKPLATRPRPGSGFQKAKQPTPTESRDSVNGRSPLIHGKAVPREPPNSVQDRDLHRSQVTSSLHVAERKPGTIPSQKIEKLRREDAGASDSERSDRVRDRERERVKIKEREREERERERRERESERERDRRELERQRERDRARRREAELESDRERERARKKVRERGRSQEREDGERSDDSLRPPKRKKVSREDDEYAVSSSRVAPKKRKTELSSRDEKPRDLSLPKKPEQDPYPRPKATKREFSPAPRMKEPSPLDHLLKAKESSLPPLPRIKKEPVPVTKHSAPPAKSSPSVSSSQASGSKPKMTVRRRRGSDIYTSSSEDEGEIRPSVKHEMPAMIATPAVPNRRDENFSQSRPRTSKIPPADDHTALRTHYDNSYIPYLGNFQSLMKQKAKIRTMLRKMEKGSSESVTESDGDGELLDTDELKRLVLDYHNQHEDLEHIQRIFSKKT